MSRIERMQWVEIVEIQTRELMYANILTGECCWEKPVGVPIKKASGDQWWELFDKHTKCFYYYNAATQKTIWHKPQNADVIPLAKLQGFAPSTLSRAEIKDSATQTTSAVAHASRKTHSRTYGGQNGEQYSQKQHTSNHRSSGGRGADADDADYHPVKRSSGSNHLKDANIPDLISETKHGVPTTDHMPTSVNVDNFSRPAASFGAMQSFVQSNADTGGQPRVENIIPARHQSHHQHSYSVSAMPTAAEYAPQRPTANISLNAAAQLTPQMNRRAFPRTNPTFFAAKQDGILGSGTQRGSSDHLPMSVDFRPPGSNTLQSASDIDANANVNYPFRRFVSPNDNPSDAQKRSRFQSDSGIEDVPDSCSYRLDPVVGPTSLGISRTHVRRVSEPDYVNAQRPGRQTRPTDMSPSFTSMGTMDSKGFSDTTTISTDWSHDSAIDTSSPVLRKPPREKPVAGSSAQFPANSSGIVLFGPSREITSTPSSRVFVTGLDDSGKNPVSANFTPFIKSDVESVTSSMMAPPAKSAVSLMPAAGLSPMHSGEGHQSLAKAQSFTVGVSSAAQDTPQVSLKTGGDAGGIGGGIYRRQPAPSSRNNKQPGSRGTEPQVAGSRSSFIMDGADAADSRRNEVIARRESAPVFGMSPPPTPDEFVISNHLNEHRKGLFRHTVPVDSMLSWTKDMINKPMLRTTNKSFKKESIEVFRCVQSYMGDRVTKTNLTNVALDIVSLGWSNRELRDEIYTQLCRQTTDNPRIDSVLRGWELFAICLSIFPPSSRFQSFLEDYIGRHLETGLGSDRIKLRHIAEHCHRRLSRAIKLGAKRGTRKPSFEEIEQALNSIYHPSMFSSTLADILEMQAERFPKRRLPWIQTILSDEVLRLNGPRTEGIFRLSGDIDEVNSLKARCDQWNPPTGCTDPHTPASLLKLWYRELHEPLIPAELYNECVTYHDDVGACLGVINKLPHINRLVFSYLIRFLQVFAAPENAAVTKMDVNNLAMVWAPNCLRCESNDTHVILENTRKEMAFLRTVIINLDTSFMHGVV